MISDLPSPLLRSFVAVADGGSLAVAARRIGRSESALSLQMARLEDIVGQPLFDRAARALKPNAAGGLLLAHARAILARIDAARIDLARPGGLPVRIGIVQDFAASVLRPVLAELRATRPGAEVAIVVGSTADLLRAMGEDRIDTALCAGQPPGAKLAARLPMAWFGTPDHLAADVLPLIGVSPPCPFLAAAQEALDTAGRPWRMALVTPSLDGLRAAAEAGLGLACRTRAGLGLPPLRDERLPALPAIAYSVLTRRKGAPPPEAQGLAAHLAAAAAAAC